MASRSPHDRPEALVNLFLDTQYTSMLWPKLISLALVAENGDHVYVELDDWDERFCAAFIVKTVLPLRTGSKPRSSEKRGVGIH